MSSLQGNPGVSEELQNLRLLTHLVEVLESTNPDRQHDAGISNMSIETLEFALSEHSSVCPPDTNFEKLALMLAALAKETPAAGRLEEVGHFHKFPELPLELRRKIWAFALPSKTHRFIEFYAFYSSRDRLHRDTTIPIIAKAQHISLSNLLKTCKESNETANFHYSLVNAWKYGLRTWGQHAKLPLDFSIDVFSFADQWIAWEFLSGSHTRCHSGAQALAHIQTLAFECRALYDIVHKKGAFDRFAALPSLQKVFVFFEAQVPERRDHAEIFNRNLPIRVEPLSRDNLHVNNVDLLDEIKRKWALYVRLPAVSLEVVQASRQQTLPFVLWQKINDKIQTLEQSAPQQTTTQ